MSGVTWEILPDLIDIGTEINRDMMLASVFDEALKRGVITKRGTWYFFGDINLGQGKAARDLNPAIRDLVYESISD